MELNYADEMGHSNGPVAGSYGHFVVRSRWYNKVDWCMIFLIETSVVSVVIGLWLARHDPALLKERLRSPIRKDNQLKTRL